MISEPIFLLGCHKSGTSLLRALLDGSPELFVIPIEAHFFQYGGYWVDYALRSSLPATLTFRDLVRSFTKLIETSNQKTSPTSPVDLVGKWNVDRFSHYLRTFGAPRYEEHGFRGFLDTYVEAIHVSLYGDSPSISRFVEKSVENAEFASILKRIYPGAKFVHILRNPYATLVSIRRHKTRKNYPFIAGIIDAMINSYYYLYKNRSLMSDYMVIRYEDLVTKPQEVMREVTRFIEIEFVEALFEPTVMGKFWKGNSSRGRQFEGISTQPLVSWRQEIRPLEVSFVNLLFGHILQDYGYQLQEAQGSPYQPCPRERLKTYFANRWLWRFKVRAQHYAFKAKPDRSLTSPLIKNRQSHI